MSTAIARDVQLDRHETQARPTVVPDQPDRARKAIDPRAFHPMRASTIGSDPYDDPTQGRGIGSDPYDDVTRGR